MVKAPVNRLKSRLSAGISAADYDPEQLAEGQRVEMEHTDDPAEAERIAMDHLVEDPCYYSKLRLIHKQEEGTRVGGSFPVAAGLAVVAEDTGRVLMLQRALDPDDPNSGKWEFPGGKLEEGELPLAGAFREWGEETGLVWPDNVAEPVEGKEGWISSNGKYMGFVARVPTEATFDLHNRDLFSNPDTEVGGVGEILAWVDPEDLPQHNPRPALLRDIDEITRRIAKWLVRERSVRKSTLKWKGYPIVPVNRLVKGGCKPGETAAQTGCTPAEGSPQSTPTTAVGPSGGSNVTSKIVTDKGPNPGSRPLGWYKPDPEIVAQDVAASLGIGLKRITEAEQGHVGKRSRDPETDSNILAELADHALIESGVAARGLAFDSEDKALEYLQSAVGTGWFKTKEEGRLESFTQDPEIADRFASRLGAQVTGEGKRNAHGVVLEIQSGALRGYPLDYGEGEVVLPRGQAYQVRDILREEQDGYVTYRVRMKPAPRVTKSVQKGTCKPGQTAARTGCTPAGGGGGSAGSSPDEEEQSSSITSAKPSTTATVKQVYQAAFEGVKAGKEHIQAVANKLGNAVWSKLPPKSQQALAKTYAYAKHVEHKLMTGFRKSREMAEQLGAEWNLKPESVVRLGRILGTVDMAAAWTVSMPAAYAATGSTTVAKVASWVPVASLAFIAGSTVVNPYKTLRAAKELLKRGKAKFLGGGTVTKGREEVDPATLAERLAEIPAEQQEWYEALVVAALEETDYDLGKALELADEMFAKQPTNTQEKGETVMDVAPERTLRFPVNRLKVTVTPEDQTLK